jgi:predicted glutamine amidotransferase
MCIIAIKKRGVQFPTKKQVKAMMDNNSDGNSMMWHKKGCKTLHTLRTLSNKDFLKAYDQLVERQRPEDIALVMHFRIKTHGSAKVENTHCWFSPECNLGFAHNGVLSLKNRDDMTDSETFFRDLFIPAYLQGGWDAGERAVNAVIGSSKFAFLSTNGEIHHYGNFLTKDGILFSNSSYEERNWGSYANYEKWYGGYGGSYRYAASYQATKGNTNAVKEKEVKSTGVVTTIVEPGEKVWVADEGCYYHKKDFDQNVWGVTWDEFKKLIQKENTHYYTERCKSFSDK